MNEKSERTRRVLVVDDHRDTLTLQAMLLRRQGYEVATASTAEAAVSVAAEQPPDLLVSDIRLPDRSGIELMRQLRGRGDLVGIAISGAADEQLVAECEAAGFAQLLVKPLPPERLLEAVKAAVPPQP